jgi:ppGpp synthetase/RelA/SpoT-type nucleotidyltranferase
MKHLRYTLLLLILCGCAFTSSPPKKINGVSFVGGPRPIDSTNIQSVIDVNANWVAIMPFGFMRSKDTSELRFNLDRQWWGERREGAKKTIEFFKNEGVQIMLKPQIWIWRGTFTGTIKMKTEADWQTFEKNYEAFILEYADLAQEVNANIFCIGTELETFIKERPEFWQQLIAKVKSVYKGKLTYAENWDCFHEVPFLNQLDYIGVDAYFPLSKEQTPTVEALKEGWQPHKTLLKKVSDSLQKPILFTEYGYRSVDYTGLKPWDFSRGDNSINTQAQTNALQALYNEFWHEPWFAGGFVWKWFDNHERSGGENNNRFTPQNKPAEKLIREHYKTHQ